MSRTRTGSLQLAIDRARKQETPNLRGIQIRNIGPSRNAVVVMSVLLCFLLVVSLPVWQSTTLPEGIGKQPAAPVQAPAFIVIYAIALGLNTIKALYNVRIKWADHVLGYVFLSKHNPGHIAFSAIASYALSIWAFALIYYSMQHGQWQPQPFKPFENEGFFSWVYFSIVTMATVGFGEITPVTDSGRAVVSAEIILGVAYQVFFFSIVASFVRERRGPNAY